MEGLKQTKSSLFLFSFGLSGTYYLTPLYNFAILFQFNHAANHRRDFDFGSRDRRDLGMGDSWSSGLESVQVAPREFARKRPYY
jgi:hypothetical protein